MEVNSTKAKAIGIGSVICAVLLIVFTIVSSGSHRYRISSELKQKRDTVCNGMDYAWFSGQQMALGGYDISYGSSIVKAGLSGVTYAYSGDKKFSEDLCLMGFEYGWKAVKEDPVKYSIQNLKQKCIEMFDNAIAVDEQ